MGGGSSNSIDIYNSNWESINYNSTSLQIVEGINDENILYDENGQKKDKRLKVEKELLKTHPFRCIGLIKIFDQLGDASVGTAFLISRNVILTTAHSIYYKHPVKNDLRFAVNILFYPALRGSIDKSQPFKVCKFKFHKKYQQLVNKIISSKSPIQIKDFKIQTQKYDFALLRLEKNIDLDQYINIIYDYQKREEVEVSVYGYPYESTKHINGIYDFKQYGHSSKSFYIQPKGNIFHMIDTSGGQSGSPILIKEKTDKYSAIGIHKGYAGNNYNIGFLLKSEAMLWIYQWQMEIRIQLKQTFSARCFRDQIGDDKFQWKKLLDSYKCNKCFENQENKFQYPGNVVRPANNVSPFPQNTNPEKEPRINNFFRDKLEIIPQKNQESNKIKQQNHKRNYFRQYNSTQNINYKFKSKECSLQIVQKKFKFQFSKNNKYSKNIFAVNNFSKKIEIKKIAKDQQDKFTEMNQIVSNKKFPLEKNNLITARILKYGKPSSKICFGILTEGRVSQKSSGDINQKQSIGYWSYENGTGGIIIDGERDGQQNKQRYIGVNQLIYFNINCVDGTVTWTTKSQKIQKHLPKSLFKIKQKLYFFLALKQIGDTVQIFFD